MASSGSKSDQHYKYSEALNLGLHKIQQVTGKTIEFDEVAFPCFVELLEQFDRLPLPEENQIPWEITEIIQQLNKNNTRSAEFSSLFIQHIGLLKPQCV